MVPGDDGGVSELRDVPVPEPGPSDVLIKVRKSAICGTDVHIWKWDDWAAHTVPVPMVVGHEFAGEIVQVGDAVTRYAPGDRVVLIERLLKVFAGHVDQLGQGVDVLGLLAV